LTSCAVGVVSDAGVEAGGGIVAAGAGVAAVVVVVAGVAVAPTSGFALKFKHYSLGVANKMYSKRHRIVN
jgi:hypothetical protein